LALLQFSAVDIEGEFKREHEGQDKKAEEHGDVELRGPNADEDAENHDEWAKRGEGAEKKDAGGAAKVDGRKCTGGKVGEHQSGVREKDVEHAASGGLEVKAEGGFLGRMEIGGEQESQREPTGDLCGKDAAENSRHVILRFANERVAAHASAATAERTV